MIARFMVFAGLHMQKRGSDEREIRKSFVVITEGWQCFLYHIRGYTLLHIPLWASGEMMMKNKLKRTIGRYLYLTITLLLTLAFTVLVSYAFVTDIKLGFLVLGSLVLTVAILYLLDLAERLMRS